MFSLWVWNFATPILPLWVSWIICVYKPGWCSRQLHRFVLHMNTCGTCSCGLSYSVYIRARVCVCRRWCVQVNITSDPKLTNACFLAAYEYFIIIEDCDFILAWGCNIMFFTVKYDILVYIIELYHGVWRNRFFIRGTSYLSVCTSVISNTVIYRNPCWWYLLL